jgi:hypothetical protein
MKKRLLLVKVFHPNHLTRSGRRFFILLPPKHAEIRIIVETLLALTQTEQYIGMAV